MTQGHREPCAGCGEETAAGSVLFSSRRVVAAGADGSHYVCSLCDELAARQRAGRRLSDDELRALIDNGAMAMTMWSNAPGPTV